MNTTNYKLELTAEELKAVHTALQYSKTNPYNPVQTERAIYSASSKIEAAQHPQEAEKRLFFLTKKTRILQDTGHKNVAFCLWVKDNPVKIAQFEGSDDDRWPLSILEAEQAAENFWKEMEGRKAQ